jgi:hypothetical protein
MKLTKHFVEFFSPGTFVSESTTKSIASWNVNEAIKMAKTIKERYGAIPYGFQFFTRTRKNDDFDSKETKRSNMYFLGGVVETLGQIKAKHDPADKILISNMESNKWIKVITNTNSWKTTQIFNKGDVLLDVDLTSKE